MRGDRFKTVEAGGRTHIVDTACLQQPDGGVSCFNPVLTIDLTPGSAYDKKRQKALLRDIIDHLNEQARKRTKPLWLPERKGK